MVFALLVAVIFLTCPLQWPPLGVGTFAATLGWSWDARSTGNTGNFLADASHTALSALMCIW